MSTVLTYIIAGALGLLVLLLLGPLFAGIFILIAALVLLAFALPVVVFLLPWLLFCGLIWLIFF